MRPTSQRPSRQLVAAALAPMAGAGTPGTEAIIVDLVRGIVNAGGEGWPASQWPMSVIVSSINPSPGCGFLEAPLPGSQGCPCNLCLRGRHKVILTVSRGCNFHLYALYRRSGSLPKLSGCSLPPRPPPLLLLLACCRERHGKWGWPHSKASVPSFHLTQ